LKLKENGLDLPGPLKGLDILQFLSGTILGSLSKESHKNYVQQIREGYRKLGLDALVAVGGDGSLRIIYELGTEGLAAEDRWNLIAIPKTIDNDVPFTERAIGFGTAVEIVTQALYDLTFTAAAHDRIMIAQVMGRQAGHLPLHAGIAGGADIILIPELVPYLSPSVIEGCCQQIADLRGRGRKFALVVVAEGVKNGDNAWDKEIGESLAQQIKERSKALCASGVADFCDLERVDTRTMVLGHLQRSHTPFAWDRTLAALFGTKAVQLIEEGQMQRLLVWQAGEVQTKLLSDVIDLIKIRHGQKQCASPVEAGNPLVEAAQSLGIYLG
jgi:6-phosphofructokinase 1